MAIGDYNKTTYANGVAPAINATNLNNNENKVKELDTAVESIETWQENEKSVSTESRIFDLTGDRTPPIPDDPAGVTQLVDNFTAVPSGWSSNNSPSSTFTDGVWRITSTVQYSGYYRSATAGLCVVRLRVISGEVRIGYGSTTLQFITSNSFEYYSVYISTSSGFTVYGNSSGTVFEISEIYIGTGAYLSKTVDRAGVPWTNVGALPVDGPFGKMLEFNGAQYLISDTNLFGNVFTHGFYVKRAASGVTQVLYDDLSANSGHRVFISTANTIQVSIGNGSTVSTYGSIAISQEYTPVLVTYEAGNLKIRVGDSEQTFTTTMRISSSTAGRVGLARAGTDSFNGSLTTRADSRVWTDEEIARWSRNPYSEDSGLIDAFSLSFASLPTFADNAAAIAGNLPVGKLYKTSTGNVLVRY